MRPDEKRPAPHGNGERAYDEAAPSESIPSMLQRAVPGLDVERIRRRSRLRAEERRSKESRRFNALIAEPREVRPPSSYGMTPDERRAYGAQLMLDGWQAWEVRARLAAPELVNA